MPQPPDHGAAGHTGPAGGSGYVPGTGTVVDAENAALFVKRVCKIRHWFHSWAISACSFSWQRSAGPWRCASHPAFRPERRRRGPESQQPAMRRSSHRSEPLATGMPLGICTVASRASMPSIARPHGNADHRQGGVTAKAPARCAAMPAAQDHAEARWPGRFGKPAAPAGVRCAERMRLKRDVQR